MQLHYLDFDFSDEASGRGSFDAMASVEPVRLAALLQEVNAVLRWARHEWGPAGALQDEGDWDLLLQAADEAGHELHASFDPVTHEARVEGAPTSAGFITVTFTLTGSGEFCDAFRRRFTDED